MDSTQGYDPADLQRQVIADLAKGTEWHGYSNPNALPSVVYQTYGDHVIKLNESPPHVANQGFYAQDFDYASGSLVLDLAFDWRWEGG
jgi:hypothetical protein